MSEQPLLTLPTLPTLPYPGIVHDYMEVKELYWDAYKGCVEAIPPTIASKRLNRLNRLNWDCFSPRYSLFTLGWQSPSEPTGVDQ